MDIVNRTKDEAFSLWNQRTPAPMSVPSVPDDDMLYTILELVDDVKTHHQAPSEQWQRAMIVEHWLQQQRPAAG